MLYLGASRFSCDDCLGSSIHGVRPSGSGSSATPAGSISVVVKESKGRGDEREDNVEAFSNLGQLRMMLD